MRALRPVVVVALALAVSGAWGGVASALPRPSEAFCRAAYRYDTRLAKRPSVKEQIQLVKPIVHHAPKDIARDAATFLDALRRRAKGDMSVVDNPRIQRAVERVNRRAANDCNLYKQDPSSGI